MLCTVYNVQPGVHFKDSSSKQCKDSGITRYREKRKCMVNSDKATHHGYLTGIWLFSK